MYQLYYCKKGQWELQGQPGDYASLYGTGKSTGRRFRHYKEGCHSGFDVGDFTIAPVGITPPNSGPAAGGYSLYYCTGGGGWGTPVAQSMSYDDLYNTGTGAGRTPLDCSESCPSGYADYFCICPDGMTPGM
jgi:hypothetical protein